MVKKWCFFALISLILSANLALAASSTGNLSHSIQEKYSVGDKIKGWINVSLSNENASSLLKTSLGDSISLIDLINKNSNLTKGEDYTCSPADCMSDYSVVSGSENQSKTFVLNNGESKVFGIKFVGENSFDGILDSSPFSIDITSNASEDIKPQLFVDILNNNGNEWRAYRPSGNFYNENYGCYQSSPEAQTTFESAPFCNKISVPDTPNLEIGAIVSANVENPGAVTFLMELKDSNNKFIISCNAVASSGGRISCVVSPSPKITQTQDFYVCISVPTSGDRDNYEINYERINTCGTNGFDFEIFAKPGKFASVGNFVLNSSEISFSGTSIGTLESYLNAYISQKYGNNCSNGCIIPIKFTSGVNNQEINVKGISHDDGTYISKYKKDGVIVSTTNSIYDVAEKSATISTAKFQQLSLDDANFSVPDEFGTKEFILKLNDNKIFSDLIEVQKIPEIRLVSPPKGKTGAAVPTEFAVNIEKFGANTTITKYEWNFGDNKTEISTVNKIKHTYNAIGTYQLKVKVTDSLGLTSEKTFSINVVNPKDYVNEELAKNLANLASIKPQIDKLPTFQKNSLNSILNLSRAESVLSGIQQRNASASTDQEYISIMADLITINLPSSISATKSTDAIIFFPDKSKINLNVLKEISGGNYSSDKKDDYADAVISWYLKNAPSALTFKEFSGVYDGSLERMVNTFEIKIPSSSRNISYFIIPKLENLKFENQNAKETPEYYYIELAKEEENIRFSTTENIDFSNLPAFVSPPLGKLPVSIFNDIGSELVEKRTTLALILLLIVFLGFVAYIIMQEWYRRKYENYLFKNRNDLYNIVSYIHNAKKKGIGENEIYSRLRKIGWNSEQLNYITKKYMGKRTGMFEIPIQKIFGLFNRNNAQKSSQKNNTVYNTKI